jgi:two-component system, LuxR family, sensor kinase FixL
MKTPISGEAIYISVLIMIDLWRETIAGPHRHAMVLLCAAAIAAIALVDWLTTRNLGLGFLYFIPLIGLATVLSAWQIAVVAGLCTILREAFAQLAFTEGVATRCVLVFVGYFSSSLFVHEAVRRRQETARNLQALSASEGRLQSLVETTPVAVVIADREGRIELANESALRMLGIGREGLREVRLGDYIPIIDSLLHNEQMRRGFRTVLESSGQRAGGEPFLARLWISSAIADGGTETGSALALVIADISEDVREIEQAGMESLMASSRVVVAALAHEVRNFASAIHATAVTLSRTAGLDERPEARTLISLAEGLQELATADLGARREPGRRVDVGAVLTDLRIVLDPELKDAGIELEVSVPEQVPAVIGERHSVLQAFLNLAYNAIRALKGHSGPKLRIAVSEEGAFVVIRFGNNSPAPADPPALFQPFHSQSGGAGLGLYVSRSVLRSFGGNVRYEPVAEGCCFAVDLPAAQPRSTQTIYTK